MEFDFINAAKKLEQKSQKLLRQLKPSFLVDNVVKENLQKDILLLRDIPLDLSCRWLSQTKMKPIAIQNSRCC